MIADDFYEFNMGYYENNLEIVFFYVILFICFSWLLNEWRLGIKGMKL